MIVAYVGLVSLFFASSTCSAYEIAKEHVSAGTVFAEHMERIRKKRYTDTDDVAILVKEGAEVAEAIHDVFDGIADLSFDNIDIGEIAGAGKDALEAGQDALEYAQDAYDAAQDLYRSNKRVVYATQEFLAQHPEILQAGKTMSTTMSRISVYLGPALGGIGLAFAVISVVSNKDESSETDAISEGLQEVHERFDQLSSQIDKLGAKIDFYQAIRPYQAVRNSLENAYRDYLNLAKVPTSRWFRKSFEEACKNQKVEPLQALEKLHRIIVKPGPEDQPHMLEAIINHYNMDYREIMGWFERITTNAYTLATMRSACFGALHGNSDPGMAHTLNQTEAWVREIIQELAKYEEKFTNFDDDFLHQFQEELRDVADGASSSSLVDSEAEQALNEMCNTTEKEWIGSSELCLGDEVVNAKRVAINDFLNKKYFWLNWLVVVYSHTLKKGDEDENDEPCLIGADSKHFVYITDSVQRRGGMFSKDVTERTGVFVTWARKDLGELDMRQVAKAKLESSLDGYDPKRAGNVDTLDGEEGYHFDLYGDKINRVIGEWLTSRGKPNQLFCHFEGNLPNFHRSIVTSRLGFHMPLTWPSVHAVDNIVAFY